MFQTRMNTSQQDKITSWNHIYRCKKKITNWNPFPVLGWQAISNRNLSEFNNCVLLTGNFQAKILFENKDLHAKGETTVLQNRAHPSQQKFVELLVKRELQIVLCSLFHIFTHIPVGIQTMYVRLEFQLCPYCNVTLNPF